MSFARVTKRFRSTLKHYNNISAFKGCSYRVKTGVIMCGLFTGLSNEKPTEKRETLKEPDSSKLSREYLIKSAGISTTEQACILLTQAALALSEAQKDYAEALFALCILMEYKLKVLGNTAEETRLWDLILEARDLVSWTRKKKQTLEIIVTNAKNMVNAGAEVAYMTGADIVGSTTGDQLNKIETFLRQSSEECIEAELKLRNTELKTIEEEGKYAQEQEEKAAKAKELEKTEASEDDTGDKNDVKDKQTGKDTESDDR